MREARRGIRLRQAEEVTRLALELRDACAAGAGRGLVRRDHDALDARGGAERRERQGEGRDARPRCGDDAPRVRNDASAPAFSSATTSGTSASARNAGETSTTAQPSAQARGAHSPGDVRACAEDRHVAAPEGAVRERRDAQLLSLELDRLPAERAEANGRSAFRGSSS